MASTNKTANLELSQFVGSDKPDFLTDYNGDMMKIDNNFASVQTAAQEAESHAQAAADSARDAQDTANQAQKDVEGAYTVANNATTLATEAKAQSDSAVHIAESAMQSAASALTVANAAQGTANEAKQKAESLETALNNEITAREDADKLENDARIESDEALDVRITEIENSYLKKRFLTPIDKMCDIYRVCESESEQTNWNKMLRSYGMSLVDFMEKLTADTILYFGIVQDGDGNVSAFDYALRVSSRDEKTIIFDQTKIMDDTNSGETHRITKTFQIDLTDPVGTIMFRDIVTDFYTSGSANVQTNFHYTVNKYISAQSYDSGYTVGVKF